MPWLAAALPYISAAGAALGAMQQSQQQEQQLAMTADAEKNNSLALDQQAANALQVAGVEEERVRKAGRFAAGEQRAAMAEAGTGLLSSTNQRLVMESDIAIEQDALNVRYGGLLEAHGLKAKSQQALFQSKAAKAQIGGVRASGYLNAFGSGLNAYTNSGGRFGRTTGGGA